MQIYTDNTITFSSKASKISQQHQRSPQNKEYFYDLNVLKVYNLILHKSLGNYITIFDSKINYLCPEIMYAGSASYMMEKLNFLNAKIKFEQELRKLSE